MLGTLLLLVGVIAGALAWLRTDAGRAWVVGQIEDLANAQLKTGHVALDDVHIGLTRIQVIGLRVDGAEHADVLVIPRVDVRWVPWALLHGRIELPSVRAYAGRVELPRTSEGLDLPVLVRHEPFDPNAPLTFMPAGWDLWIGHLVLIETAVALPDDGVTLDHGTLSAELSVDATTVLVEDVVTSWAQRMPELGLVGIQGQLRLQGADLDDAEVVVQAAGAQGHVAGRIAHLLDAAPMSLGLSAYAAADAAAGDRLAGAFAVTLPDGLSSRDGLTVQVDVEGALAALHVDVGAWWGAYDRLEARGPGDVQATGTVRAADAHGWGVGFDVTVPEATVLGPLGSPVTEGRLTANGTASSGADGVQSTLTLSGTGVGASGFLVDSASVPLSLVQASDGVLQLRSEATRLDGIAGLPQGVVIPALTGSWSVRLGDVLAGDFDVQAPTVDLAVGRGVIPLQGTVVASIYGDAVELTGTLDDRRASDRALWTHATADLAARTVVVDVLRIQPEPDIIWNQRAPIMASFGPDGGLTRLTGALQSDRGRVELQAQAGRGDTVALRGTVDALDLDHVTRVAELMVPGTLPLAQGTLTATIDASLGGGILRSATARIDADRLTVGADVKDLAVSAEGGFADGRVQARVSVRDGGPRPRPLATVSFEAPVAPGATELVCGQDGAKLVLQVPELAWTPLRHTFPSLPESPLADLTLSGELQGTGDPCDPVWTLHADATAPVGGRTVAVALTAEDGPAHHAVNGSLAIQVDGADAGEARFLATHDAPGAWVQADDPLTGLHTWAADLTLRDVPSDLALSTADGTVEGRAHAAGSGTDVLATQGQLRWAGVLSDNVVASGQLGWATEEGRLLGDAELALPDGDGVAAELGVDLVSLHRDGRDAAIDGRIRRGEIGLDALVALSGGLLTDGIGMAHLGGTVAGTVGQPTGELDLVIEDGGFVVAQSGVRYRDVQVRAHTQGRTLTVTTATATSRPRFGRYALGATGAGLTVDGKVDWREGIGLVPDLHVRLDRFWAMATKSSLLELSGELEVSRPELKGTVSRIQVTGAVSVGEGRFDLDRTVFLSEATLHLDPGITFVDGPPTLAPDSSVAAEEASFLDQLDIDVQVDLGRRVDLAAVVPLAEQANLVGQAADLTLDSQVSGKVRVRQVGGILDLRGRVGVTGRVRLLTAQFDIEEGTLSFVGGDLTNPAVALQLRRDSRAYGAVTARVSGTPSDLVVSDLASADSGDEANVIALLLLGRPLTALDPGQAESGTQLVESAVLGLAGAGLQQAVGADLVDSIRYSSEGGLAIGWSIGNAAFLTVAFDPVAQQGENLTEARISWYLGPHVELDLQTGDAGASAAWLLWKERF